jgi:hypothetical protein
MGSISSSRGVRGGAPGEGRRSSEKQDSAGSVWSTLTNTPTPPPPPNTPTSSASHTTVSTPCSGVRSLDPKVLWKEGRLVRTPSVSAHPGCMEYTATPGGGGVEDRDAGQDRLMLRSDGNSLTVMLSEAGAPLTTQVSVGIRKPVPYSPSLPPTPSHPPRGAHISARCAARATWRRLSRA